MQNLAGFRASGRVRPRARERSQAARARPWLSSTEDGFPPTYVALAGDLAVMRGQGERIHGRADLLERGVDLLERIRVAIGEEHRPAPGENCFPCSNRTVRIGRSNLSTSLDSRPPSAFFSQNARIFWLSSSRAGNSIAGSCDRVRCANCGARFSLAVEFDFFAEIAIGELPGGVCR